MSEEMVLLGKACLDVALMRWRMQTRRSVLRRDSAMVSLSGQQCDSRGDQQSGAGCESEGTGISKQTDLHRYDLPRRRTVESDRIVPYPHKKARSQFFEHYFIADYHARELKRYITSGARSDGLLNLDKKDFFKIMVPYPSPGEQKNIAESLNASQHEINLLKRLAEKYKTQKRGLMQKVLTGQWRIRPEIVERYVEV